MRRFKRYTPPAKRSKNKFRHKWIDDGKKDGVELYTYTCDKCRQKRIKSDFVSYSYYDESGKYIGNRAPECVAVDLNGLQINGRFNAV